MSSFSSVGFERVGSFVSVVTGVSAGFTTAKAWSVFGSVFFSPVILSSPFAVGAGFSAFPSDSAAGVGDIGVFSEVVSLEGFSVGNIASLLSTFPSVVSFGVVPSVCFFSSVEFEGVVAFVSVVTGVSAGFTTAEAWSAFGSVFFSTVVFSSPFVVGTELSAFPSDSAAGIGATSEVVFPLEGFSVGNVASLLSTFPSVVSLGVVPSVCFFSSVDFEVVVSFVSVVTGVFAGFTTAGAWSDFFASTLAVVVGV